MSGIFSARKIHLFCPLTHIAILTAKCFASLCLGTNKLFAFNTFPSEFFRNCQQIASDRKKIVYEALATDNQVCENLRGITVVCAALLHSQLENPDNCPVH